ncbi:MAG: DUF4349 domain-containing protein, partial [Lachnospiraceae bacterium]|nr:DUF4349 domain-containing protein [Lachnospiraceae bacterium]
ANSFSGEAYKAVSNDAAYEEAAEDFDYEEESLDTDSGGEPIEVDGRAQDSPAKKLDREKIVYTGRISLETLDWKESKSSIKKLIEDNDGIIQSQNEYYNDSDYYYDTTETVRTLQIQARIPSAKFQEVMESAEGMGHITERSMDASNVTREYYDVQARLKTKQTELERFQEILSKADKIKDILEIEDRISDVQYEIDSAKSQLENMDLDVAYSTINITLTEVRKYSKDPQEATSRLQETLIGAGHFFMSFLWGLFRFVLYVGPSAVVVLAILVVMRKLFRKFYKPKKRKPLFRRFRRPKQAPAMWVYPGPGGYYPGQMPPYGADPNAQLEQGMAQNKSDASEEEVDVEDTNAGENE